MLGSDGFHDHLLAVSDLVVENLNFPRTHNHVIASQYPAVLRHKKASPQALGVQTVTCPNGYNGDLRGRGYGKPQDQKVAKDFRRIALSMEGAEEGSHMGAVDFRVGGRIFATLAAVKLGYGNLMLTQEVQQQFVGEAPEIFVPIAGGWGRSGATHVVLAKANEDLLTGALRTAWKIRMEKNGKTKRRK